MAEPTIQLGGGNWAGKSGNLLGYYEQNKKFYAEDFTFSRSTSGTRVNSSGLIETASVISTTEEVANGDFSTDTDWTKGSGWTISGGSANQDNSTPNSGDLTQSNVTTSGKKYKVTFDLVVTSGTISALVGGHNLFTTSGTKTFIKTATSSNLTFRNYSNFVGSIDNVSVKEVIENNIPRVDYLNNSNGSLILEPQRSNLITYSSDFSEWNNTDITIGANGTSPNGEANANLIQTGSAGSDQVNETFTISAINTATYSVFIKRVSGAEWVDFLVVKSGFSNSLKVWFNIKDGLVGSNVENGTTTFDNASVKDFGNGWYRLKVTTTDTTNNTSFNIRVRTASADASDTRVDNSSYYLWGAQLESGSYATTLINTSGSSVTRNADGCELTNASDSIGQTEGTIYVEFTYKAFSEDMRMGITDGSSANYNLIRITSGGTMYVLGSASSSLQYEINCGALTDGQTYKAALKYKSNDINIYLNGVSKGTDTSANIGACNRFGFDNRSIGANPFYSNINKLSIYNTALTDSELATLTTL